MKTIYIVNVSCLMPASRNCRQRRQYIILR